MASIVIVDRETRSGTTVPQGAVRAGDLALTEEQGEWRSASPMGSTHSIVDYDLAENLRGGMSMSDKQGDEVRPQTVFIGKR